MSVANARSVRRELLQLQAAANRAEQILPEFTPQAMANLMWAFAAMSHNPGELGHHAALPIFWHTALNLACEWAHLGKL